MTLFWQVFAGIVVFDAVLVGVLAYTRRAR